MKNIQSKQLNTGRAFSDFDGALRYLSGKDQEVIREDDPEFFSFPAERIDSVSFLSSSRRILQKKPRKSRESRRVST